MQTGRTGEPWLGDFTNKYYTAAASAIENVWNKKPMFIKEGGLFLFS